MKLSHLLPLLAISSSAWSALPPLHQHLAELNAIINHPDVVSHLGSEELLQFIQHIDNYYLVHTDKNILKVEITYCHDYTRCGPSNFEITVLRYQN